MKPYQFVLDQPVLAIVLSLKPRERGVLLRGFEWLAQNPRDEGDAIEYSASLRPVFTKRFGEWAVTFWQDHSVFETRIVSVTPLDK